MSSSKARRGRRSILKHLSPEEAREVLSRLLKRHAELRSEAECFAERLLTKVDFEAIASDVEGSVRLLGLDELSSSSGRHRWGYTEPSEAAWLLLEERLEPFLCDLERHLDIGLESSALETCKGLLLALYRLRDDEGNPCLQHAPDFPAQSAAQVLMCWAKGGRKKIRKKGEPSARIFPQEFVDEYLPEWDDLLYRAMRD